MNIPESFLEDSKKINRLTTEMSKVILGQDELNKSLVIGLLVNGHLLIEGLPGLAKTLAIKTLASLIDSKFQRVQFTPDLLPSDLIGTLIFNTKTSEFSVKKGPLFTNFLLADEINRAPAKVQSALLEAMAVEVMAEALAGGGSVALQGLGTLTAETKEPRRNFNPRTRTEQTLARRRRYSFVAGPKLIRCGEELRRQQEGS
jgi:nucleoid DNA-binding protein